MKKNLFNQLIVLAILSLGLSSCFDYEDEGPLQYQEESFNVTEFDRLEIGDAMIIRVEQGNYFSIQVRGDRRNLDDLEVYKSGNTLVVRYDDFENRKHETYIDIVMPSIAAVNFSGATNSVITGFDDLGAFRFSLSGASVSQLDVQAGSIVANLSGASVADMRGSAESLQAEISGASSMKAFTLPTTSATLQVSGASVAKVSVSSSLDVSASGASTVVYRGDPSITRNVTSDSSLQRD